MSNNISVALNQLIRHNISALGVSSTIYNSLVATRSDFFGLFKLNLIFLTAEITHFS